MAAYPKKIATFTNERERRTVTVYQTARDKWRIYLKIRDPLPRQSAETDQQFSDRDLAIETAKRWARPIFY